jgi:hypothetical protein
MSKRNRKKASAAHRASTTRRRALLVAAAAILLASGILTAALVLRAWQSSPAGPSQAAPGAKEGPAPVAALADDSRVGRLNGRWLRLDGGYVLEIRGAGAGGALDVTYLNPRPIHVARAEASREGPALKVFVELRAPGYPGSTYTLTYDEPRDRLEGVYFQAALGQSFDVAFVRMK